MTGPSSEQDVLAWLRTVCTEKQMAAAELYYRDGLGVRQIGRRLLIAPATAQARLDAVHVKLERARLESASG